MDFSQISLLLVVAAFFGVIVKKVNQPLLLGYIFAGFALVATGLIKDRALADNLGKLGVVLLLFLVGLEMNVRDLFKAGKKVFFAGAGQVVLTAIAGFLTAKLLGFSFLVSTYFGIAFSFSSTILVVNLLSEKNSLDSFYGIVTVGMLLIQDIAAIFALVFLTNNSFQEAGGLGYIFVIIKIIIAFSAVWFLSKKVLPRLFEKYIANSPDLIFITSIAWALGLAGIFAGPLGFSLEMGGLLAGLALSNLPEHLEIGSRTKPLRDFFLTLFFLSLGANLVIKNISSIIFPAFVFSLFVLIIKPLLVMIIMGFLNFRKRTSFFTSLHIGQISEFSLKIVAGGLSIGHLQKEHVALSVMVAVITMTLSTYFITAVEKIYLRIKGKLSLFERKNSNDFVYRKDMVLKDHVVLVGCLRTGVRLLPFFNKKHLSYVIVDFNPDVYKRLTENNHPVIFGDISDPEIIDAAKLDRARLLISTVNGLNDNLVILEHISRLKIKPLCLFTSVTRTNAIKLYEKGADYVVVPEIVAGDHIRNLLKIYGIKSDRLKKAGQNHFNRLIFT